MSSRTGAGTVAARNQAYAIVVIGLAALPGQAQAADAAAGVGTEQWQLRADAESWHLPDGESLGMGRLALRQRVASWLSAGIDGSAAVRGQRGGFITLGVGAEAYMPMASRLDVEAGLSIQAGGGRGGSALAGGGLMTRVQLGLRYAGPGHDSVSVGASRVDFPEHGTIHSGQLYVAYTHPFDVEGVDAARPGPGTQRVALFIEPLAVARDVTTIAGTAQSNLGLAGFEWQAGLGKHLHARLAAGGAASGSSSGYMQVLAGLEYRLPLARRLALATSVSAGAGGGGGVDTGGGMLVEAAAGLSLGLTDHDSLDLSGALLKAPSASFSARGITLRIAHRFGVDEASEALPPAQVQVHPVRVRVVDQEYRAASAAWSALAGRSFGALGVQADYFMGESLYLSGQGLAAWRGQFGAYMVGLAGVGWHQSLSQRTFVELEGLLGAAGGGGAAVGSGAVGQLNLSLGWRMSERTVLQFGLGRLEARRGGFAADIASLSLGWHLHPLGAGD